MTNSADLASCESADIQRRILELIEGASSIAISGHTSPDGDALGSVLGLGLSLMKFLKSYNYYNFTNPCVKLFCLFIVKTLYTNAYGSPKAQF